jgi:hypothetical protein
MQLTTDEQRLLAEFRKLTPTGRDDLLAYTSALVRKSADVDLNVNGIVSNQCSLKPAERHPESDKSPIFTE